MKKYILTDDKIEINGKTLYRIQAIRSFGNVREGELGGFIEKEYNLSHLNNAWVNGNARVWDNARVWGNAKIDGNARVCDNALVWGNAKIDGNAWVNGNARVCGNKDYIVFKNWWSSGRYFTWTRSNNMWKVGCFYGTGEKLIKKAYADSELSGREYERVVKYVESILKEE